MCPHINKRQRLYKSMRVRFSRVQMRYIKCSKHVAQHKCERNKKKQTPEGLVRSFFMSLGLRILLYF